MAVAFDAVGPNATSAQSTGATTLSWTHTNSGSGVALTATGAFGDTASSGKTFTGAKLDPAGANTTIPTIGGPVDSGAAAGGTLAGFIQMWGLANVSSGAHTIQLTASAVPSNCLLGGSVSYSGADTASPFGTAQTTSDSAIRTSHTITHTGSVSGNMVTCGCCDGDTFNASQPNPGTKRHENDFDTATRADNIAQADSAGGGSVTFTWTTAASDHDALIAVEVKAPAAGGAYIPVWNEPWAPALSQIWKPNRPWGQPQWGAGPPPPILPWLPRRIRIPIPAPAFRHAGFPFSVVPPPVATPVYQPVRARITNVQQPRRSIRMLAPPTLTPPARPVRQRAAVPFSRARTPIPLRLQVSGPPPSITRVGPTARWAELRRRPRATMPLYLQVSGPPPAIARVGPMARWAELRRRPRAVMPPPLQVSGPILPLARPSRRFVAYPARPLRRQLSLPIPVPRLGRRVTVPIPRLGKRQAQLTPPVVVIVQPFTQQEPLPRKALWFATRIKRTQQQAPSAAAPPVVVIQTGPTAKARWLGFRWKRTQQARIIGAPPPAQALFQRPRNVPRLSGKPLRPVIGGITAVPVPPIQAPSRRKPAYPPSQRPRGLVPPVVITPATPVRHAPRAKPPPGLPRSRQQPKFAPAPQIAPRVPQSQRRPPTKLTTFLRRIGKLGLNIFGQPPPPPPTAFPGCIHLVNLQVEPMVLSRAVANVAISDLEVGGEVSIQSVGGITITNRQVGGVTERIPNCPR